MPFKIANPENEYKKYKELRKEDVEALQQWIKKQPHLPPITELEVIQFFQSCYFKTEATKRTIDAYFTLKSCWPEYFKNRDPNQPQLRQIMDSVLFTMLPDATPEGYYLVYARLMQYESSKFSFLPFIKLFDMGGKLWLNEVGTANGLVFVFDMDRATLGHIASISISNLKNMLYYLQEALPTRLKGMHFLNTGTVMDKLMMLMKPFIKKELLEVLHLHPTVGETFFRFVPQQLMPKDYGGSCPSFIELQEDMKRILLENAEYIIKQENHVADESKRIGKLIDPTDGYGIDGSFRKLEID